jgi:uncharacterized protein
MLIHVAGLLREPIGATRRADLLPEEPVRSGWVELVHLPGAILARFDAEVGIDDECSRCLSAFGYTTRLRFEEMYVQQVDVSTGAKVETELDPGEDAFRVALDHTIDTTEAVRQYTEMAAAMQPLCRPDCPGLCSQCGQDLTVGACTCDRTPADSRWAALADLKLFPNG